MTKRSTVLRSALLAVIVGLLTPGVSPAGFIQTNLASDVPGLAAHLDPNLKNPWGISSSPTSPFWVSDEVTGTATLYDGSGTPQARIVTIPGGHPTGQVFNSTASDFAV